VKWGLDVSVSSPGPYGGDVIEGKIKIDDYYVIVKDSKVIDVL